MEANESLESAATRELQEEVGLTLKNEQLMPHAILSLPAINQVCVSFLVCLPERCPLTPALPEALDARWFSERDYASVEIWGAAAGFNPGLVYQSVRSKRFVIYQQSNDFLRFLVGDGTVGYLWRRK